MKYAIQVNFSAIDSFVLLHLTPQYSWVKKGSSAYCLRDERTLFDTREEAEKEIEKWGTHKTEVIVEIKESKK